MSHLFSSSETAAILPKTKDPIWGLVMSNYASLQIYEKNSNSRIVVPEK